MIGKNLGHYEILGALGKGGMGEVYRARDTKLGREVAIKVLPQEMSGDPERVARFDREARLLASLQHANIASIYGFERAGGAQILVMELVEGQNLEDRLRHGALSHEEVVRIAIQMATGLEAAHEKGIVHRDLKPANVMLTPDGDVKILDFGLARAWYGESPDDEHLNTSPTISAAMTRVGTILGTAAYMSPEQARGKHVDRRADIWAFGAILWELVTGTRLFAGETISDALAAVIRAEPEWKTLSSKADPAVFHLIERCLVRDPRQRLRDIGEARILLQESAQPPHSHVHPGSAPPSPRGWRDRLPWAVAVAAMAVAIWAGFTARPGHGPSAVMRFALSMPDELELLPGSLVTMDVAPDGSRAALVARRQADRILYVRNMDSEEATPLAGTEGASNPVFSPDGQWIAFAQDGKLRKISVSGGPPTTICNAPSLRGASWGAQGQIAFAPDRATGLMLVSESGGAPIALTELEQGETNLATPSHRWPELLPDGKTVLFTRTADDNNYDIADIVAVSVDTGAQKVLVHGGTFPKYVPAGYLVFMRQGTMFAARFSPDRVELLGPPVPVLEGVAFAAPYGCGQFAFSDDGLLLYLSDSGTRGMERLVWLDRNGRSTPASTHERIIENPRVSPDGRRAALQISEGTQTNIWLLEFARDSLTRFTFDDLTDRYPVWSPDGEWIVFGAFSGAPSTNLFRKRSNGTGGVERLTQSPDHQNPSSWSPDGKILAFDQSSSADLADIFLLHLDREPLEPEIYLSTPFNERSARFSTDGAWIAYSSNESGQDEVYVRPLSGSGGQVKVSMNGGTAPAWSSTGTELFYRDAVGRKLMSVRYSVTAGEFVPELAREMFDYPPTYGAPFDVSPLDSRVLVDEDLLSESISLRPRTIVVNWFEELARKVPAK